MAAVLSRRERRAAGNNRAIRAIAPPPPPPEPKYGAVETLTAQDVTNFVAEILQHIKTHGGSHEANILLLLLHERAVLLDTEAKSPGLKEDNPILFDKMVKVKTLWRAHHQTDVRIAGLRASVPVFRGATQELIMRRANRPAGVDRKTDVLIALWLKKHCGFVRSDDGRSFLADGDPSVPPLKISKYYTADIESNCPEWPENDLSDWHTAMQEMEGPEMIAKCKELCVLLNEPPETWCNGNILFLAYIMYGPPRYGKSKLMIATMFLNMANGQHVTYGGSPNKYVPVRDMAHKFGYYGLVGGPCDFGIKAWASCDVSDRCDGFQSEASGDSVPPSECNIILYSQDVLNDVQTWFNHLQANRIKLDTPNDELVNKVFFCNYHDEAHMLNRYGAEKTQLTLDKKEGEKGRIEAELAARTRDLEEAEQRANPDPAETARLRRARERVALQLADKQKQLENADELHQRQVSGIQALMRQSFLSSFGMLYMQTGTLTGIKGVRACWGTSDMHENAQPAIRSPANDARMTELMEEILQTHNDMQQLEMLPPAIPDSDLNYLGCNHTVEVEYNDTDFTPAAVFAMAEKLGIEWVCYHNPAIREKKHDEAHRKHGEATTKHEDAVHAKTAAEAKFHEAQGAVAEAEGQDAPQGELARLRRKAKKRDNELKACEVEVEKTLEKKNLLAEQRVTAQRLKAAANARQRRADELRHRGVSIMDESELKLMKSLVPQKFPTLHYGMLSFYGGTCNTKRGSMNKEVITKLVNSAIARLYIETQCIGSDNRKVRLRDPAPDPDAPDFTGERLYPGLLFLPTESVSIPDDGTPSTNGSMLTWAAFWICEAIRKNQSTIVALWTSSTNSRTGNGKGITAAALRLAFGEDNVSNEYSPKIGNPVHIFIVKHRPGHNTGQIAPILSPRADQSAVAEAITVFDVDERDKIALMTMGYDMFNGCATVSHDTKFKVRADGAMERVKLLPLNLIGAFSTAKGVDSTTQMFLRSGNMLSAEHDVNQLTMLVPKHVIGESRCLSAGEEALIGAALHPYTPRDERDPEEVRAYDAGELSAEAKDEHWRKYDRNQVVDLLAAQKAAHLEYIAKNGQGDAPAALDTLPPEKRYPVRKDFLDTCKVGKTHQSISDNVNADPNIDGNAVKQSKPEMVAKRALQALPTERKPYKKPRAVPPPGPEPPRPPAYPDGAERFPGHGENDHESQDGNDLYTALADAYRRCWEVHRSQGIGGFGSYATEMAKLCTAWKDNKEFRWKTHMPNVLVKADRTNRVNCWLWGRSRLLHKAKTQLGVNHSDSLSSYLSFWHHYFCQLNNGDIAGATLQQIEKFPTAEQKARIQWPPSKRSNNNDEASASGAVVPKQKKPRVAAAAAAAPSGPGRAIGRQAVVDSDDDVASVPEYDDD